jgi:hypothetical protein
MGIKKSIEKPDGIMITISAGMLKERGIRDWLGDFLSAMNSDDHTYWYRLGCIPKQEVLYIYFVVGGKVKYRYNFVMYEGPGEMEFTNGKIMDAKAWLVGCGPVVRAPYEIRRKGFRGFRYTEFIF